MVRIMIKGGVWKNTEDEILKAAVMKYGKNQWARISSLLVRKTPKQCKARWYEWIDPSIKKTEWSREEEEKLLHLAKIMPTQWRTIAPMIGRTAAQCLEHYERLLDAAAQEKTSGDDAKQDEKDDPRRLKQGEIDPLPEAKPARPDPVDMDEDEKEMLSEARARLANVKGKKAKRKAREKQLEEARRLAALQKKRELKAAGIELATKKRKKKHGLDYNAEIPFARAPVPGFYDTGIEKQLTAEAKKDVKKFVGKSLDELEQKTRDDAEEKARKKDSERQKLQKKVNLPAQLQKANQLNDPEQIRRRSKLILPAPQMSEEELETIQRTALGTGAVGAAAAAALATGSSATKALLGQYGSATPAGGATPFAGGRTPLARTPMQKDSVLMEAQNLIALTTARTPLAGGENTPLHTTDFSSVTPKRAVAQTPNVLSTPMRVAGALGGMTPARTAAGAAAAGFSAVTGTPIRDNLRINNAGEDGVMMADGQSPAARNAKKAAAKRQTAVQRAVKTSLMDLPAPVGEYQFVMPELAPKPEESASAAAVEEDAEDRANRVVAETKAKHDEELKKRSAVLQRQLPRPYAVNFGMDPTERVAAAELAIGHTAIREEMLRLLRHDNAKYPIPGAADASVDGGADMNDDDDDNPSAKKKQKIIKIDKFSLSEIARARALIEDETKRTSQSRDGTAFVAANSDAVAAIWDRTHSDYMYVPALKGFGHAKSVAPMAQLQALRQQFEVVRSELGDTAIKAKKLEAKCEVLTAGYQMRASKLSDAIREQHFNWTEAQTELECFAGLSATEARSIPLRVNQLKAELAAEQAKEAGLQSRYQAMAEEREKLTALLAASAVKR